MLVKDGPGYPRESFYCWCGDTGTTDAGLGVCAAHGVACLRSEIHVDLEDTNEFHYRAPVTGQLYSLNSADFDQLRAACALDTGDTAASLGE